MTDAKGVYFTHGLGFMPLGGRVKANGRRPSARKMPWWNLVGVVMAVLIVMVGDLVDGMRLPPIHWNSSNPMFKASNNDHVIEVNLYDDIDFVCPHLKDEDSENYEEYYLIHQVSKGEYDDCNLYSPDTAVMIVNCSSPGKKKRFTILFEPFQSIPNVPEYHPGGRYFFISTSTGQREGIANPHQGACVYKNMKLTIQVCCESTTPPPLANSTLAIPSTDSTPRPSVAPGNASTTSDLSTTTPKIPSTPHSSHSSTTLKDSKDPQGSSNPKLKTTVIPYRSKPPDRTKDPDDEKRENEIDDPEHHVSFNRASDSRAPQTLLGLSLIFSAVIRHLR